MMLEFRSLLLVTLTPLVQLCTGQSQDVSPNASLISNLTNLTDPLCPGTVVQMTCTTVNTTNHKWFMIREEKRQQFASYEFSPGDNFPRDPALSANSVNVQVTSAVQLSDPDRFNATSVLIANVSTLVELDIESVQCGEERGELETPSNLIILNNAILTSPPLPSSASCFLLPVIGGANISLQWSPSFTSQYAVERYRVSVNPDPSSCSSDQVSPSEDYSCSGLVLGTHYTFTVTAINCEDQEGERHTITAVAQSPQSPASPAVVPVCTGSLSKLTEIRVEWNAPETGQSGTCVDNSIKYTVYLVRGSLLNQTSLSSSDCNSDGICSISYSHNTYFQSEDPATITISACNAIECRNTSLSGDIAEPRLTTANWVLLIISVFVELIVLLTYFCMIIGLAIRASKRSRDRNYLSVSMARCALIMLLSLLSLMLWIASIALCVTIGVYVGTQDNTCEQSTRDNLITSTLVLALLSLLLVLMVIPVALVRRNSKDKKIERSFGKVEPERQKFTDVEACPFCLRTFGGYIKTINTICDACGKIVCEDCCTQEVYLPYMERSSEVCRQCYTIYIY